MMSKAKYPHIMFTIAEWSALKYNLPLNNDEILVLLNFGYVWLILLYLLQICFNSFI